ncbi:MAG: EamA family transporter [Gaiellaceae bacterium]
MPLTALGLALGAAVLHASWNLVLRAREDTEAATAVAVIVLVVVVSPFAAATWHVGSAAWPYVAGSGALELAYVALLAAAYRRYELSVVYPVARGLAPVAALVLAVAVARGSVSTAEVAGVAAVACGVLLVRGTHRARGALLGLGVAAAIGGYTVLDRFGIRHASAFAYLFLVMLPPAVLYPPAVGLRRFRRALAPETMLVGVLSAAAFALVLLALRRASAPSVSAVRETSVVIATVLAAVFLKERVGPLRFAGAVLVAVGVTLLAL